MEQIEEMQFHKTWTHFEHDILLLVIRKWGNRDQKSTWKIWNTIAVGWRWEVLRWVNLVQRRWSVLTAETWDSSSTTTMKNGVVGPWDDDEEEAITARLVSLWCHGGLEVWREKGQAGSWRASSGPLGGENDIERLRGESQKPKVDGQRVKTNSIHKQTQNSKKEKRKKKHLCIWIQGRV